MPVPPAPVEPDPVAFVSDANAVDLNVNDPNVPIADLRDNGRRQGIQGNLITVLTVRDAVEHRPQFARICAQVNVILNVLQALGRFRCNAPLGDKPFERRVFKILVEQVIKRQALVIAFNAHGSTPTR